MRVGQVASCTLVVLLAAGAPAQAQVAFGRLSVSSTGRDAGTCSQAAPCRTFAYAVTQVPTGGEIVALDTADYGPVTITKAMTLLGADGATAIIHGAGTADGVTVNAGASDLVNLRGLDIENVPTGVTINSGTVNLDHDTITGGKTGIAVGSAGQTTVSNTTITGPSDTGISDTTAASSLVLTRVSLAGGGGNAVRTSALLTMSDSTIVGWTVGLQVQGGATFVKGSVIAGSGTGVLANGFSFFDTTTITGCTSGVTGTFSSYGNNNIVGNTTNYTGRIMMQPQVRSGSGMPTAR